MRGLATGGAGFVGRQIVKHFQAQARVLDKQPSAFKHNPAGLLCEFIEG